MLKVCADDFGQSVAISKGILQLVAMNRLQAVSCMVTEPACKTYAPALQAYAGKIELGLHLNLTHQIAPLWKVIAQSYRLWPASTIQLKQTIAAQLHSFHQLFGCWPDFIDGHQHVHQLPRVAELLFVVLQELKLSPWLRRTYAWGDFSLLTRGSLKKLALCLLGGHRFAKQLVDRQFSYNQGFAGDYDFFPKRAYRDVFLDAVAQVQGDGLIMCHPGFDALDMTDPISKTRQIEYDYFSSDAYLQDRSFGFK